MPLLLANVLQTPRYSFFIFLAGFVAFRSFFFVILFFVAALALKSKCFNRSSCSWKDNYKIGHVKFVQIFCLWLVVMPILGLFFFYLFFPPDILKEVAYFTASYTFLPLEHDKSMLIHAGIIKDNNAAYLPLKKINNEEFHKIASAYMVYLGGFVYSSIVLSYVFQDLKCIIPRLFELSKSFPVFISIIICLFFFAMVFLSLSASDYILGGRFSSGFTRLSLAFEIIPRRGASYGGIHIWYLTTFCYIYILRTYFECIDMRK